MAVYRRRDNSHPAAMRCGLAHERGDNRFVAPQTNFACRALLPATPKKPFLAARPERMRRRPGR